MTIAVRQMKTQQESSGSRNVEEWMLICQHRAQLGDEETSTADVDWLEAARRYPNLDEAPTFITRSKDTHTPRQDAVNLPNPAFLQGNQHQVYEAIQMQVTQRNVEPIRMIVSGTGESFLIA